MCINAFPTSDPLVLKNLDVKTAHFIQHSHEGKHTRREWSSPLNHVVNESPSRLSVIMNDLKLMFLFVSREHGSYTRQTIDVFRSTKLPPNRGIREWNSDGLGDEVKTYGDVFDIIGDFFVLAKCLDDISPGGLHPFNVELEIRNIRGYIEYRYNQK